jgi:hypothetical protein
VMKRPALHTVFNCFHVQRLAVASDAWLAGRQVALPDQESASGSNHADRAWLGPDRHKPCRSIVEENSYFSAFRRLPDRLNQVRGRTKPMNKIRPHRMDTVMIKDDKSLDSYWDLEIQETLLDVAAAIAATGLAGASAPVGEPATQSALVAHWIVCQPITLNGTN